MMSAHAEKCPVCNGTGKVEIQYLVTSTPRPVVDCHGCNGTGWITVTDTTPIPFTLGFEVLV
jgi:DnaJ-class molecular chaperone